MKVYVASSWRNEMQPWVVRALRHIGCEVYDFRNPAAGDAGFHWSETDPKWKEWTPTEFTRALLNPLAEEGFRKNFEALLDCDLCVLVLPCGRSSHLEAGYAIGAGIKTLILLAEQNEPELMYKMAEGVCTSLEQLIGWVKTLMPEVARAHAMGQAISDIDNLSDLED